MNTERANVVSRGECGKCGSSDGNVLYDNGSRYCFVCETYTAAEGSDKIVSVTERKVHTMNTPLIVTDPLSYSTLPSDEPHLPHSPRRS